jgi:hypothetical protein
MKRKPHSTSLVLLLVCIFTFWWGISVLTQTSVVPSQATAVQDFSNLNKVAITGTPLMVHETVDGATHVYSGTYMPKNACDSFGSGIRYTSAGGGHVSVLLITEPSTTACAQASSGTEGEPFSVSIKVSEGGKPSFDGVLLNGSQIPAELVASN